MTDEELEALRKQIESAAAAMETKQQQIAREAAEKEQTATEDRVRKLDLAKGLMALIGKKLESLGGIAQPYGSLNPELGKPSFMNAYLFPGKLVVVACYYADTQQIGCLGGVQMTTHGGRPRVTTFTGIGEYLALADGDAIVGRAAASVGSFVLDMLKKNGG